MTDRAHWHDDDLGPGRASRQTREGDRRSSIRPGPQVRVGEVREEDDTRATVTGRAAGVSEFNHRAAQRLRVRPAMKPTAGATRLPESRTPDDLKTRALTGASDFEEHLEPCQTRYRGFSRYRVTH